MFTFLPAERGRQDEKLQKTKKKKRKTYTDVSTIDYDCEDRREFGELRDDSGAIR
jgi:hypothetical protein